MSLVSVTSDDTLVLNGRVINDLVFDDVSAISFPNELLNIKTGKNGNAVLAKNAMGLNATLTLRVARGSSDDRWLNSQMSAMLKDFPSMSILNGSFTKRLGDGQGNVIADKYTLSGGAIAKMVEGKENVSGDVTQGESVYVIKFSSAARSIE